MRARRRARSGEPARICSAVRHADSTARARSSSERARQDSPFSRRGQGRWRLMLAVYRKPIHATRHRHTSSPRGTSGGRRSGDALDRSASTCSVFDAAPVSVLAGPGPSPRGALQIENRFAIGKHISSAPSARCCAIGFAAIRRWRSSGRGRRARRPSPARSAGATSTWSSPESGLGSTSNGIALPRPASSSSSTRRRPDRRSFRGCAARSMPTVSGADAFSSWARCRRG